MVPLLMHNSASLAVLVYFVFGIAGTALHLWRSPTMEFGPNSQTVNRLVMGAAVGVILPFVGGAVGDHIGVPSWIVGELPLLVKGCAVLVLSLGGSYVIGDELARRAIAKAKREEENKP